MESFDLWPQPTALGQVIAIDLVLSPMAEPAEGCGRP